LDDADRTCVADILSPANITAYIDAILDVNATTLPHLDCPAFDRRRYGSLAHDPSDTSPEILYFFALDLRNCLPLLPRLIGSIVEVIRFLGPARCALSIVEGNSPDGTYDVLAALRPALDALTTTYYFQSTPLNPLAGDRISGLAELRNLALGPLLNETEAPRYHATNTTVAFVNDVAICAEDILELLHQRRHLRADMVCAFDWTYVGADPTFYDVWVAKDMAGDTFFRIPPDGSWDEAGTLFPSDPAARARHARLLPFQAFSCWNGATAFTASPVLDGLVRFRGPRDGECYQGEPQLFCKDLWWLGYGRIAVVPSVNLEYTDDKGKLVKALKGYTSENVLGVRPEEEEIEWSATPPEQVRCMPSWEDQFWEPWNVTLGERA
jgi:alpha-1,3-mannosyltransferase